PELTERTCMNMNKETYERLLMDVTEFDTEDVITTSGEEPGPGPINTHTTTLGRFEQGLGLPLGI
ncbi:hypothetical protein, partial [uncultured Ruminococcus sp.]|uniref:hypothetical protein n=1 Tax=uncultured Ruminococcus sp. TaxID=165186 RepID=UPI00292FE806